MIVGHVLPKVIVCGGPGGRGCGVTIVKVGEGPLGTVIVVSDGVGKVVGGRVLIIGVEEVELQRVFALFCVAHPP